MDELGCMTAAEMIALARGTVGDNKDRLIQQLAEMAVEFYSGYSAAYRRRQIGDPAKAKTDDFTPILATCELPPEERGEMDL